MPAGDEQRLAVIDLGSNSFRLVVFTARDGWWKRTDEIYEAVRIGEGLAATGELGEPGMARAQASMEVFAHFCRASGLEADEIDAVATSAIRDATNAREFLDRAEESSGLSVRVLPKEEEARYGYLAAVNSTTLSDGVMLDIGGGSMQLVHVERRLARELDSWPLGAVRMTERFLPTTSRPRPSSCASCGRSSRGRSSARRGCGARARGWSGSAAPCATWPRRPSARPTSPSSACRASSSPATRSTTLVDELADLPPSERGSVPGIKPNRADIILGGALVVQAVMEEGGFEEIDVTEAGLREGVFFERFLAPQQRRRGAVRRRPPRVGRQPRRPVRHEPRPQPARRARRAPGARAVRRAGRGRAAPGRQRRARAALGGGAAPRHRDDGRLRRPPQALALPRPQRGAAGLRAARGRAHRPGGPLPPQGHAVARPVRLDRGQGRRRAPERGCPRCCAWPRTSSAAATSSSARRTSRSPTARCAWTSSPTATRRVARWAAGREGDLFERAFGRELEVG